MGTGYSILGKYVRDSRYEPDMLVQIGTKFRNGRVQESLEQLLDIFRFVEQSLVIKLYVHRSQSLGDEVQNIFDETSSTVEAGVQKLIGNQSPDGPVLLRTQSELNQDQKIETVVDETVWGYLKSTAEIFRVRTIGDLMEYITVLAATDKPFYSRWSKDSPIESFDHRSRFSYADQSAHFEYWEEVLDDDAPLIANDATIKTWGDLKEALRGKNKVMDESGFSQGTFSRPLREAMRLVPLLE